MTSSQQPTSNDEVTDRDAGADVIAAGPEPRGPLLRPGGLVWLFVLVEAVALAVSVAVAVHYRAEVRRLQSRPPPAVGLATSLPAPELGTVALALPADGTVTGTGLHGQFAEGRAAPFPAGQAPCGPSS